MQIVRGVGVALSHFVRNIDSNSRYKSPSFQLFYYILYSAMTIKCMILCHSMIRIRAMKFSVFFFHFVFFEITDQSKNKI